MLSMQSRTKKSTLVLLGCLALAGLASCSGGGSSRDSDDDMKIYPPPENRAPEAVGSILDQTVSVGGTRTWNTQELEPYFRDPDGDTLTYTFEFVSGASLLRVISDGSGNELLAVRGLAAGTATVRVTASDPGGLTAQQDLGIRVEAVAQNRAPETVGSIPDQTVAVGGTKTWDVVRDLQPYFRDPDGDALTYTFQFAHYSGVLSDPTKSGSAVMVRGLAAGTSTVRVTASDGELSAVQRFTLRVEAEERNRAPEAVGSIPDQTVAVGGTRTWNAQELEPYFRDPDGDTLTYTFEFVSGASLLRVTSDGSGNELLAVRGLAAGTATVRVTASDPRGLTAQQDLDVQVQDTTPDHPDTRAQAAVITVGETVTGSLSSPDDVDFFRLPLTEPGTVTFWTTGEADTVLTLMDGEGNDLSASATSRRRGGTVVVLAVAASSEGRVSVTTDVDDLLARVTGREGGRTGGYNLHNEVVENLAPRIIKTLSSVSVQVDGDPVEIDLSGFFEDPEGGDLTFSTSFPAGQVGPVSLGLQISGSILRITSPSSVIGPVSITVTASDPFGLVTFQVLSVTVTPGQSSGGDDYSCVVVSPVTARNDRGCIAAFGRGDYYGATATNNCAERVSIRWEFYGSTDVYDGSEETHSGLGSISPGGSYLLSTICTVGRPQLRFCVGPWPLSGCFGDDAQWR